MTKPLPTLESVGGITHGESLRCFWKLPSRSLLEVSDLVNECALVYFSVSKSFDPSRGCSFSSYYCLCIKSRMATILSHEWRRGKREIPIEEFYDLSGEEEVTELPFPAPSFSIDPFNLPLNGPLSERAGKYLRVLYSGEFDDPKGSEKLKHRVGKEAGFSRYTVNKIEDEIRRKVILQGVRG